MHFRRPLSADFLQEKKSNTTRANSGALEKMISITFSFGVSKYRINLRILTITHSLFQRLYDQFTFELRVFA